jgi:hypothetical protein
MLETAFFAARLISKAATGSCPLAAFVVSGQT